MNFWFNLPREVQLGFLFLLGAFVGGQVNRGTYRLAWFPRLIGPWSAPHPEVARRAWFDRIPILGWLGLRRESNIHGRGFWVRPLLIELFMGLGFAALYVWEMSHHLVPPAARGPMFSYPNEMILSGYFVQIILISLMAVATFIDFDEKTIPDAITIPGTLLILILMTTLTTSALPFVNSRPWMLNGTIDPLLFTTPNNWSSWLNGPRGLLLGLGCFAGWCYALVPKLWTTRRGFSKAVRYLVVSMFRTPMWWQMLALAAVGCLAITGVWAFCGIAYWKSLLTALVGMAFGGGIIWAVRIVGTTVLNKEAMGFGDVTLMAMIGAYAGWQASIMIFFMAPFAALFISVATWIFTGRRDIPFGPYLSMAALVLIVKWESIWQSAEPTFSLGLFILGAFCVCLAGMALLLTIWRFLEERLFGHRN